MSKMIRLEWALFPLVLMFIERERKGCAYDGGFLLYLFSATFFNYSRILLAPRLDYVFSRFKGEKYLLAAEATFILDSKKLSQSTKSAITNLSKPTITNLP